MQKRGSTLNIGYLVMDPAISVDEGDGCGVHTRSIVRGLRRRGHDLRLLGGRVDWSEAAGEAAALPKSRRPEWSRLAGGEWVRWATVYERARALFEGCDVVHERHHFSSAVGLEIASDLGIPLVVEMNAPSLEEAEAYYPNVFDDVPKAVVRAATARYLGEAAHTFVVSKTLRDLLVNRWGADPARLTVLPNAADPVEEPDKASLERERRSLGLAPGPVIMTVGSLQAWHGIPDLVEAFGLLTARGVYANLLIVGDGAYRPLLEERLRDLGVGHRVALPGTVSHERARTLIALGDVAVSPHPRLKLEYYMSPIKLFEFMAAGKAIVATRLGQPAEIIEHEKSGLLVPPGCPERLADSIQRLLADPGLRASLGRQARAASQNYTWSAYAERLEGVYRGAIAAAGGPSSR